MESYKARMNIINFQPDDPTKQQRHEKTQKHTHTTPKRMRSGSFPSDPTGRLELKKSVAKVIKHPGHRPH